MGINNRAVEEMGTPLQRGNAPPTWKGENIIGQAPDSHVNHVELIPCFRVF